MRKFTEGLPGTASQDEREREMLRCRARFLATSRGKGPGGLRVIWGEENVAAAAAAADGDGDADDDERDEDEEAGDENKGVGIAGIAAAAAAAKVVSSPSRAPATKPGLSVDTKNLSSPISTSLESKRAKVRHGGHAKQDQTKHSHEQQTITLTGTRKRKEKTSARRSLHRIGRGRTRGPEALFLEIEAKLFSAERRREFINTKRSRKASQRARRRLRRARMAERAKKERASAKKTALAQRLAEAERRRTELQGKAIAAAAAHSREVEARCSTLRAVRALQAAFREKLVVRTKAGAKKETEEKNATAASGAEKPVSWTNEDALAALSGPAAEALRSLCAAAAAVASSPSFGDATTALMGEGVDAAAETALSSLLPRGAARESMEALDRAEEKRAAEVKAVAASSRPKPRVGAKAKVACATVTAKAR